MEHNIIIGNIDTVMQFVADVTLLVNTIRVTASYFKKHSRDVSTASWIFNDCRMITFKEVTFWKSDQQESVCPHPVEIIRQSGAQL